MGRGRFRVFVHSFPASSTDSPPAARPGLRAQGPRHNKHTHTFHFQVLLRQLGYCQPKGRAPGRRKDGEDSLFRVRFEAQVKGCVRSRLRPASEGELGEDVAHVVAGSLDTDEESVRDLCV
jgi:hypothetical protein